MEVAAAHKELCKSIGWGNQSLKIFLNVSLIPVLQPVHELLWEGV